MTVPDPRGGVDGIGPVVSAKNFPEVKALFMRVQVVFGHKRLNSGVEHKVIRVVKVNFLNCQLVADHRIGVIGDPLGNPVVTATRFKVPGFIVIGKEDPVGFSSPVLGN